MTSSTSPIQSQRPLKRLVLAAWVTASLASGCASVEAEGAWSPRETPATRTQAAPPAAASDDDAKGARAPGDARRPDPRFLVPATGPCPEFKNGYATFTPDGVARRVLLWVGDAAQRLDGPLIFSWHSTLPGPETSTSWLGEAQIRQITAIGGIIAAPATGSPRATRPWDSTQGGPRGDHDQRLMDEVVACAIQKVGIDTRRIHAIGMSAGGLKSAQVSLRRSGYIASVVIYSGGLVAGEDPPDQDPTNPLSAMILYGGARDISPVDGINYTDASRRYLTLLRSKDRFGFLCNHNGGHSVPRDTQASAWQFLQDHPFGTQAYAEALPSGFSRYCALPYYGRRRLIDDDF